MRKVYEWLDRERAQQIKGWLEEAPRQPSSDGSTLGEIADQTLRRSSSEAHSLYLAGPEGVGVDWPIPRRCWLVTASTVAVNSRDAPSHTTSQKGALQRDIRRYLEAVNDACEHAGMRPGVEVIQKAARLLTLMDNPKRPDDVCFARILQVLNMLLDSPNTTLAVQRRRVDITPRCASLIGGIPLPFASRSVPAVVTRLPVPAATTRRLALERRLLERLGRFRPSLITNTPLTADPSDLPGVSNAGQVLKWVHPYALDAAIADAQRQHRPSSQLRLWPEKAWSVTAEIKRVLIRQGLAVIHVPDWPGGLDTEWDAGIAAAQIMCRQRFEILEFRRQIDGRIPGVLIVARRGALRDSGPPKPQVVPNLRHPVDSPYTLDDGTTVAVGQVWEDRSSTQQGRTFEIIAIDLETKRASIRNITAVGGDADPVRRTGKIALHRFIASEAAYRHSYDLGNPNNLDR